MKKFITMFVATATLGAVLVGCGDAETPPAETEAATAALLNDLILSATPGESVGVAAVRESAQDGEEVIVTGVIGGRTDPIAANRALFTLLDDVIVTCDEMGPDDECETPWDACCEAPESITANIASVQVSDDDGRPLAASLAGAGLSPGDRVTVVGTFKPSPDGAAATIDATGIHIAE